MVRAARSDRGDGGGISLVWMILVPVLLLLVWGGLQVAFSHYGKSMAIAAAQAGVRAAISVPADPSRAEPAVRDFIAAQAPDDVLDPQITVTTTGTTVTVTVTGRSVSVTPGLQWSISGEASGQVEQLAGAG